MERDRAGATELTFDEEVLLLEEARRSVDVAVRTGAEIRVSDRSYPPALHQPWATFVTLRLGGDLRGCIGSTAPTRALIADVLHNSFGAALLDRRFEPCALEDIEWLDIHVSMLSPLEAIPCASEAELLSQILPGRDGLLIEDRDARATFLPLMWEQLDEKAEFLRHLKLKAGFPAHHWPKRMRAYRYTVKSLLSPGGG